MNDDFAVEFANYMRKFPFRISVVVGRTYSSEFKEFHQWCEEHLGKKHKDWFLHARDKTSYTLFLKDSKWSMFMALKYSDSVVGMVDLEASR